jgi:hypothetical protein
MTSWNADGKFTTWSPGRDWPDWLLFMFAFHEDAEACMCVLADMEDPEILDEIRKRVNPNAIEYRSYGDELEYQKMAWAYKRIQH